MNLFSCYNEGEMPPRVTSTGGVSQDVGGVMTTPIVSPDSDNLKRCSHCHEWKPLEAFSRNAAKRDGRQNQCKACTVAWYEEHKDRVTERNKVWADANRERKSKSVKEWHERNKDRVAAYKREWNKANKHRIAEKWKIRYANNKEALAEYRKTWGKANPDKVATHHRHRRARKANAEGNHTAEDLAAIRASQTDKKGRLICWGCGYPIIGNQPPPHMPNASHIPPHLDHWVPLDKEGTNGAGNLHYMHGVCNLSKGAKHPTEIGRLL